MLPDRDPEGKETEMLRRLGRLDGARVVEIGCGTGRLTWRYARAARSVVAIDPDGEALEQAARDAQADLRPKLTWIEAEAEALPFSTARFDTAIFAWSL